MKYIEASSSKSFYKQNSRKMKNLKLKTPSIYEMSDRETREQNGGTFKGDIGANTGIFFRFIYDWLKDKLSQI